ncbi:MAG: bifunctional protein-serine/threonine kinase/phosphatase [Hahellaceae bacterium]|nr:bifunctional protein-serine/threonine kinase/phosphatase [Hahellaceae bacterium]
MTLRLDIGSCSQAGIKAINEDAVATCLPDNALVLSTKGALAVLADGVSSAEAGREASQLATSGFIDDYYKTPETWTAEHAGRKSLTTLNLTLYKKSHEFIQEEKGYLCTFSGLIIKSRTAHTFHLGDSHIYHLHSHQLHLLTTDHTVSIGKGKRILARALGMDSQVNPDYANVPVTVGDQFLLTSDGIHDFLSPDQIKDTLMMAASAQEAADQLVKQALTHGSDDNISAVVVKVIGLPDTTLEDYSHELTRLPFPPELSTGMRIDGLEILEEIFASARSQLYRVRDVLSGDVMVMKTPSRNYEEDVSYIDRFIQEEWIGKRINSPYVVKVATQSQPRRFLYYLMKPVTGISLEQWMQENPLPKPRRALRLVLQIAQGLKDLHRYDTIHQDLKPANIMVSPDDRITLVDFGSVFVAGIAELYHPLQHEGALGTATYSDPHYLLGRNTGRRGDLYALATITYELFTGELPYGEAISDCRTGFDYDRLRYQPASQYNPIIPIWFDRALEKGVAIGLDERYDTIDHFIKDLQHPNPDFLRDVPTTGNTRSTVAFWQILSGFWMILLILIVTLFSCQGPSG